MGMGRGIYCQVVWQIDVSFCCYGVFIELIFGVGIDQCWISGLCIDCVSVCDEWQLIRGMMGNMFNFIVGECCKEWFGSGFLCYEQDLVDGLIWYVGFGYSECMFDYWELFLFNYGLVGVVNVFIGVQLECIIQFDVGLQYKGLCVQVWVLVYVGQIQDYILFIYYGSGMMGMSQVSNVEVCIVGVEVGLEVSLVEQWKLGGMLVYVWGENCDQWCLLLQMLLLEVCLSVNWEGQCWSVGVLLCVVIYQYCVVDGQGNVVVQDFGLSVGFVIFVFNVVYCFSLQLQFSVGVDNLFDCVYSEYLNLVGSVDFGFLVDLVWINELGCSVWMKLNYWY